MSEIHLCLQPKSEAAHLTNFLFRIFLYFVSPEVRAVYSQKEENIFFPLFQISGFTGASITDLTGPFGGMDCTILRSKRGGLLWNPKFYITVS